ncbi:hypothetical protein Tco_0012753 [Tanacetum coccineum]
MNMILYDKKVTLLKNDFKKEESRNIDREIALEKRIKQLDNIVFKRDQSAQTVHMLTKPQFFYDHTTKQALETLLLAEESRSKMLLRQKDPIMLENKVNTLPVDYAALNQLYKDFETRFVPKTKLSAEQAFWSQNSVNSPEPIISSRPTIVEVPKELPKVSMVNTNSEWRNEEEDPEMEEEEEEMEMNADEEWDGPEWILLYQGADLLYPPPPASDSESEIEFEEAEAEAEAEAEVEPIPPPVPANPEPEAVTVAEIKRLRDDVRSCENRTRGAWSESYDVPMALPSFEQQAAIERSHTQRVNAVVVASGERKENARGQGALRARKVKFAAATLQGRALTWWNSQVATMGLEAANQIGWTEIKIIGYQPTRLNRAWAWQCIDGTKSSSSKQELFARAIKEMGKFKGWQGHMARDCMGPKHIATVANGDNLSAMIVEKRGTQGTIARREGIHKVRKLEVVLTQGSRRSLEDILVSWDGYQLREKYEERTILLHYTHQLYYALDVKEPWRNGLSLLVADGREVGIGRTAMERES